MRNREMARDIELTELGLGAAHFGTLCRGTSDEPAASALDAAWMRGIRYFDTAPHYGLGLSERRLKAAFSNHPRGESVVSSKVGRLRIPRPGNVSRQDPDGFLVPTESRRVFDYRRHGILRSLDETLARTGLDYIDIVYLHDPDQHWKAASTKGVDALGELLEQGALEDLLPIASYRNDGIVVAGVHNSGLLSRTRPGAGMTYDYAGAPSELVARAVRIAEACERHGVALPEAALVSPFSIPLWFHLSRVLARPTRSPKTLRGISRRSRPSCGRNTWISVCSTPTHLHRTDRNIVDAQNHCRHRPRREVSHLADDGWIRCDE